MSEPSPDDGDARPGRGRLPPWWLRAAGLALLAIGAGLGAAGVIPLAAWGAALLGLSMAAFGGAPPRGVDPVPPPPEAKAPAAGPARTARIGLAAAAGILLLYGLARVTLVFLDEGRASDEWWPVVLGAGLLVAAAIWAAVAEPRPTPVRVEPPEHAGLRAALVAGIVAALAIQVAVPMTYYLGEDRFDERFAWRMFSAVRVYRCDLNAFDLDDGRATPVPLGRTIHVAWINTMQRGREGVIQRYLTWRCAHAEVGGARVVNRCTTPEGEQVPDLVREIDCASGELRAVEVAF